MNPRPRPLVLATVLALATTVSASWQARELIFPDPDIGEQTLESRRAAQLAAADDIGAPHAFEFVDRLPETGITFRHRIVSESGRHYRAVHYDHGNALAVADVDGDGLLDLYFVNQAGASELWRNLGGLRFENITVRAGVALDDRIGVAASFADVDNDGDPDLFATSVRGGNALFENLGDGRFRDATADSGLASHGHSSGAVFLDFDLDGRLDLFVTNVGRYTSDEIGPEGQYQGLADAFEGHLYADRTETSRLYRNVGGLRFEDITVTSDLGDLGWNGDAGLVNFHADARPDLYVLNMQGDDHYLLNSPGSGFVEQTATHFPRTPYGSMGLAAFDYDNDGDQDLFLTDMHSDMNYAQEPEQEGSKQRARYTYQEPAYHLLGNAFYRNDGNGRFTEISDEIGVETYWPWGVSAEDVNADGWTDLFVASSMNYPFRYQVNSLLLNEGGRTFAAAEFVLGIEPRRDGRVRQPWFELDCDSAVDAAHTHCEGQEGRVTVLGTLGSRTSAIIDLDADGDLDIVTGEFNAEPQVLVSDLAQRHEIRWLSVDLEGDTANRDGLGARIEVVLGDRTLTRVVDGKSGYLSQSSTPEYFGLAAASRVDEIRVTWPGGAEQTVAGPIETNRVLVVRQE